MIDREKVIKGLECCLDDYGIDSNCSECPYAEKDVGMCMSLEGLLEDAFTLLKAQEPITGETSDGYHTFNELYHHRAVLFSVIVANYPDRAWKSKKHHDGTMYNGMFIVGMDTPDGQATYHYDVDPYWDMFKCRVLDNAPEWDGHTPAQAIERIGKLKAQEPRLLTLEEVKSATGSDLFLEISGYPDAKPYMTAVTLEGIGSKGISVYGNTFDFVRYNLRVYGWRLWTSHPTEEQREAAVWLD